MRQRQGRWHLQVLVFGWTRCETKSFVYWVTETEGFQTEPLLMRRFLRYLRIAFSVTCGIACVLLIVLWVRSYWTIDGVSYYGVEDAFVIESWKGIVSLERSMDVPVDERGDGVQLIGRLGAPLERMIMINGSWSYPKDDNKDGSLTSNENENSHRTVPISADCVHCRMVDLPYR